MHITIMNHTNPPTHIQLVIIWFKILETVKKVRAASCGSEIIEGYNILPIFSPTVRIIIRESLKTK